MNYILAISLLIISYLLGSIPSALIIGKTFKNVDVREHGSKNLGATNTFRVLGLKMVFKDITMDEVIRENRKDRTNKKNKDESWAFLY